MVADGLTTKRIRPPMSDPPTNDPRLPSDEVHESDSELIARAKAATKGLTGPWYICDADKAAFGEVVAVLDRLVIQSKEPVSTPTWSAPNAGFIVSARALVPDLADALEAANERAAAAEGERDRLRSGLDLIVESQDADSPSEYEKWVLRVCETALAGEKGAGDE